MNEHKNGNNALTYEDLLEGEQPQSAANFLYRSDLIDFNEKCPKIIVEIVDFIVHGQYDLVSARNNAKLAIEAGFPALDGDYRNELLEERVDDILENTDLILDSFINQPQLDLKFLLENLILERILRKDEQKIVNYSIGRMEEFFGLNLENPILVQHAYAYGNTLFAVGLKEIDGIVYQILSIGIPSNGYDLVKSNNPDRLLRLDRASSIVHELAHLFTTEYLNEFLTNDNKDIELRDSAYAVVSEGISLAVERLILLELLQKARETGNSDAEIIFKVLKENFGEEGESTNYYIQKGSSASKLEKYVNGYRFLRLSQKYGFNRVLDLLKSIDGSELVKIKSGTEEYRQFVEDPIKWLESNNKIA